MPPLKMVPPLGLLVCIVKKCMLCQCTSCSFESLSASQVCLNGSIIGLVQDDFCTLTFTRSSTVSKITYVPRQATSLLTHAYCNTVLVGIPHMHIYILSPAATMITNRLYTASRNFGCTFIVKAIWLGIFIINTTV